MVFMWKWQPGSKEGRPGWLCNYVWPSHATNLAVLLQRMEQNSLVSQCVQRQWKIYHWLSSTPLPHLKLWLLMVFPAPMALDLRWSLYERLWQVVFLGSERKGGRSGQGGKAGSKPPTAIGNWHLRASPSEGHLRDKGFGVLIHHSHWLLVEVWLWGHLLTYTLSVAQWPPASSRSPRTMQ